MLTACYRACLLLFLVGVGFFLQARADTVLARLCPRALHLEAGRIAADGPFEQVRARYLEGEHEPGVPAP